jgi:hypothetical protein
MTTRNRALGFVGEIECGVTLAVHLTASQKNAPSFMRKIATDEMQNWKTPKYI